MKWKWMALALPATLVLSAFGDTLPPALHAPVSNGANSSAGVPVIYSLPMAPKAGTAQLQFSNASANATLFLNDNVTNNFVLPPSNLTGPSAVVSSTAPALADGVYAVVLSYQDALGEPAAFAQATNVVLKTSTAPPVLLSPANGMTNNVLPIQYVLPDSPLAFPARSFSMASAPTSRYSSMMILPITSSQI